MMNSAWLRIQNTSILTIIVIRQISLRCISWEIGSDYGPPFHIFSEILASKFGNINDRLLYVVNVSFIKVMSFYFQF